MTTTRSTLVETKYGRLQGNEENGVQVWKGVPFAAAPVGALRYRPPQPPAAWSGVRQATAFSPTAPQLPSPLNNLFGREQQPSSEDCLYLNVWSPAADGATRPVLVWIHGGAFTGGSGSTPWYDGAAFARNGDVVVVTINYRLGLLGFLHLAELGGESFASTGNLGILDQVAALRWVHENIAAFGGDPDNVTVFGESAGGMSVGTLLGTPSAKGLFHKAILQSGAAHNVRGAEAATQIAREALKTLEVEARNVAALRELSVEQILAGQAKLAISSAASGGGLFAQPVVDGTALPRQPLAAVASGSAAGVPLLIGTNLDEMKLFSALDPGMGTEDGFRKRGAAQAGEATFVKLADAYAAGRPNESKVEAWTHLLSDRVFRIPAVRLAETQEKQGAPVWMYRFDYQSPALDGKLGACHALEIPFVWNNLNAPGSTTFTGERPDRQPLADRMQAAWIAFARGGNPNAAGLPSWPAYESGSRATLIFDVDCRVENDPDGAERRLWDGLL
ncbi:MAG TPA: carboxylesterase/lipase family protein [Dehalococcoidia bacterium]|nr:carboxylesterase/lipase family protein [Dehalococcoidia bacterium]